jgi:two-component system, sensor histidine kinase
LFTQDGGGSGLGLHITKDLVEKHGGTIEMLSEGINQGCTTIIELPLYKYPQKLRSLSCHSNDSVTAATNRASCITGHNCLVVDDSLPNRKMLARLLERSGYKCTVACHGQEAIDIIEADQATLLQDITHVTIDTILMDYEMPILNGPDATKVLREKGYSMAIFGVTGNVLAEDVHYFISMGANKVLSKPVSMASIEEGWESLGLNGV